MSLVVIGVSINGSGALSHRAHRAAERRRLARRRRTALAGVAALAALAGAITGAGVGDSLTGPEEASEPACPPAVAGDPATLVGRMLMVRMEAEATPALRRRARRGEIAGVILFPPAGTRPESLAVELERLREAASAGGMPPPLVAIDQEGGEVERLPALPPERVPAGLEGAGEGATALAEREGEATGRALAAIGANVDLAPILDVPATPGAVIAPRALGRDPVEVADRGVAFARGLATGGVAATAKHFPGLGLAIENTDLAPSTIAAGRAELEPGLSPFRAAIDAGIELVMVANALYPALDDRRPASVSATIVARLLREELGYDGVVVTDDLGAGAIAAAGFDEGEAAVAAARARADLLLFALSDGARAHRALLDALRRGRLEREALLASCARLTELAERR